MKFKVELEFFVDMSDVYEKSKEIGLNWSYSECLKWTKRNVNKIVTEHCVDIRGPSPASKFKENDDKLDNLKLKKELLKRVRHKKEMRDKWRNPKRRIR